jgi:hypothetical protein
MRLDNRRRLKKKDNIIDFNLALLNPKYDNSEMSYGDKSWIIEPENSSLTKINLYKIFAEEDFRYYIHDLKNLRFYFISEKSNQAHRTLEEMSFNLKYFYQYLKVKEQYLHLHEIGFNELLEYSNFLKLNNSKKSDRKFADIKKVLIGLHHYSLEVHEDIKNNNFPLVKFQSNADKKEEFYTKDEYVNLSKMIVEIINDYFNDNVPEHLFVKASFWLMAFCTGFNMTGVQSLKGESFSIIEEDKNSVTYLIIGEKNRNNDGFQKAVIKLNKSEEYSKIFIKTLNKLKDLSKEISSISKSFDKDFLFLAYRPNWKTQERTKQYFRYNGEWFSHNVIAKKYFKKHNTEHLFLSARKIRNQYSLEFFNLSKSEEFVAKVMNHSNVKTTIEHYMKFKLSDETVVKFQLFQELLLKFSNSVEIDWSLYQKSLGIQNRSLEDLMKDLSTGVLDTPMGNCSNKKDEQGNICDSYIKCFSCKNYSLISDKDLWKIYSFKESLEETKKDSEYYKEHYKPIIESINNFISNIDKTYLLNLRKKYKENGKHPFWRNPIMLKQITTEYEANI